ncbi:hypothetical protein ABFA25_01295 [Mycobacterium lepromatosis]|nr:hypothetical protein [Mycobacterium lepromatosis]UKN43102.1 hypothetical protein MLPF_3272 [Mycobacterium lepromatosis]
MGIVVEYASRCSGTAVGTTATVSMGFKWDYRLFTTGRIDPPVDYVIDMLLEKHNVASNGVKSLPSKAFRSQWMLVSWFPTLWLASSTGCGFATLVTMFIQCICTVIDLKLSLSQEPSLRVYTRM